MIKSFNKYFKENFGDLHEACCDCDHVALKYKEVIKKTWYHQQSKTDHIVDIVGNYQYSSPERILKEVREVVSD